MHKNRLHILNFAVHPEFRRRGVARGMVRKLIARLSAQRRNKIVMEIRESNLDAQRFFREIGFRAVAIRRLFYRETREDAYVFRYRYRVQDENQQWMVEEQARC